MCVSVCVCICARVWACVCALVRKREQKKFLTTLLFHEDKSDHLCNVGSLSGHSREERSFLDAESLVNHPKIIKIGIWNSMVLSVVAIFKFCTGLFI